MENIINSRANIKNYGGEIEAFLKWIKPYIGSANGHYDLYAIVHYEESKAPTLYFLND